MHAGTVRAAIQFERLFEIVFRDILALWRAVLPFEPALSASSEGTSATILAISILVPRDVLGREVATDVHLVAKGVWRPQLLLAAREGRTVASASAIGFLAATIRARTAPRAPDVSVLLAARQIARYFAVSRRTERTRLPVRRADRT